MSDAPERIWLQDDGDYRSAHEAGLGTELGVTWCDTSVNDRDTQYVRADLYAELLAELAEAKASVNKAYADGFKDGKPMSDAPERIWATTNPTVWKVVTWFRQRTALGCTEYVRADLHAELEAQLAEAKEALCAAQSWLADGGHVDDDEVRGGATGAASVYRQVGAALAKLT